MHLRRLKAFEGFDRQVRDKQIFGLNFCPKMCKCNLIFVCWNPGGDQSINEVMATMLHPRADIAFSFDPWLKSHLHFGEPDEHVYRNGRLARQGSVVCKHWLKGALPHCGQFLIRRTVQEGRCM